MKQEVEIKIKLSPSQFLKFKKWLKRHTKYQGKEKHLEYYLDNPKDSFVSKDKQGFVDTMKYLRVRFQEKGASICFKDWYLDKEGKMGSYCDEYEYDVSDGKEALELFDRIGYSDRTKVEKMRKVYTTKDYEFVIDDVVGLGVFVEIELRQVENVEEGILKIYKLLLGFGFRKIRRYTRGYVSIIWNKHLDLSEVVSLSQFENE